MSKTIKIYCEGKKGSHDYEILMKVIDGFPSIQVEPLGGVRGTGAIIQYKETHQIVKSDFYLLFRDRDFDKQIPEKPQLEQDFNKKYCYFSYRNTIENYLFSTSMFFAFLNERKLTEIYGIFNEQRVNELFIKAAEQIKVYQAVRHTMGKMRTDQTNFGTKWTKESGILPESLEEEYCKQKALEKIIYAKNLTDTWTEPEFNKILGTFLTKFDNDFMDNFGFLVYFQGKDFASSLKLLLKDFPIEGYYKYARTHFNYTLFEDLVDLRNLIASKI